MTAPKPRPKKPPKWPAICTAPGSGNGKVTTTAPFFKNKGWLG